jgi:spore maturation protein CgeB
VGLTASLEEYGNTSLSSRLSWAKKNQIDFYYSFRSIEYFSSREEYSPFFSEGFEIYPIEFGANPLIYYPVYSDVKDCDFVFLASSNQDKQQRYSDWLQPLLRKYSGFLDGPGWSKINQYADRQVHRYIYSRAKVGINLHIDDSVDWASELNERTYILAACGVPQLIDNPKLLNQRFSRNSMFQADTPKEYYDLFKHIINSPEEAGFKALSALEEVYKKHTTFHRADAFLRNFINK